MDESGENKISAGLEKDNPSQKPTHGSSLGETRQATRHEDAGKLTADQGQLERTRNNLEGIDSLVDAETANRFYEALDRREVAIQYQSEYSEKFGRKQYPSEAERLAALEPFVKKEMIEQKKKQALAFNLRRVFPSERKRVKALSRGLEEEQRLLAAAKDGQPLPDNWSPYIIETEDVERMHGERGSYHYHSDQFGNTFFTSPDWSGSHFANILSSHFNVNRYHHVMMPWHDGTFTRSEEIRFLAEASKTIDPAKITAEDCDKIDPLPVNDPGRSFASSALINLLSGSVDTVVRVSRHDKNQSIRKDGTYYLYDLASPVSGWNKPRTAEQFDEIALFLKKIPGEKEHNDMLEYIAQTTVMLTTTDDKIKSNPVAPPVLWQFPIKLAGEIAKSSLGKKDKDHLARGIKSEIQRLIKMGDRQEPSTSA